MPRRSLFLILVVAASTACGATSQVVTPDPVTPPDPAIAPDPIPADEVVHENPLEVHFLDVGQGDGMLIVTPSEHVILLDAGPPAAGDDVVRALRARGVTSVDLALVTHAHADHLGGLVQVFQRFEVERYGDPGFPHESHLYADVLARVALEGSEAFQIRSGQRIVLDEGIELRVLGPGRRFIRGSRSDVNANSLILLLTYGEVSILLTGDAERPTEQRLVRQGWLQDVDVLKVAHHGSDHASTRRFLNATTPEWAVISCGEGNSYGHPADGTLERLERHTTGGVMRTDILGTITLTTDGETIEWEPAPEPAIPQSKLVVLVLSK